ncbi:major facilitator superfamily domain-containing protein [Apodospora peruviana]|uniref:Major facilitator superfamily domain-containing protein n=1 Tax=Apodospora peruviana TaxID=516989 RepID=A0AAE0IJZ0_9PEZI|nr:major facilitator superfamily domain-containing protein [Apodospora peruviana]
MEVQTNEGFASRGPAVFAVTTATLVLATVFVAARMVSRIGIVRRVGADDYIIVLAWLIAFFLSLTIDFGTQRGLGRHDANISASDRMGLRMCEYVFSVLYNPALMATKTSILVFYLRLARNTQKILRMASWAVLAIVNIAGTILTFMNIFQCEPMAAAWNLGVPPTKCIPLLTEFICSAPVNVVTDLAILALPLPVLTGMRLPPRQKTILVITFTVGIFVTVVDVVRIYYLQQAINIVPIDASDDPSAIFGQSAGFPWNASLSLMWSAVEVNVGITCACVPTLKPLIIRILPAMIIDPDGTQRSSTGTAPPTQGSSSQQRNASTSTKQESSSQAATTTTTTTTSESPHPQLPSPAHMRAGSEGSEEISFRDFLSLGTPPQGTSSLAAPSQQQQQQPPGMPSSAVYFGFVNMQRPKSMLRTSASESFKYCTVVSVLFFLWGFSYGLLNTLNNVVADIADMSQAQTLGLTSLYFGAGYFFGPLLVGEWLLRHDEHRRTTWRQNRSNNTEPVGGFKATFIVGLLIYGAGTIMFWPGAVLNAYGGFMVSTFVVGFGLAVLETAANPFLALCGPPQHADARLLFAQAVQAVGSVLSGLLANNVFFARIEGRPSGSMNLIDVQWTYLAVTLLCVLLALVFYYMPLPEVTDRELGRLASRLPVNAEKRSIGGKLSLRTWCIVMAVASQWTYVAAQENMSIYFHELLTAYVPETGKTWKPSGFPISVLNYLVVAHAAFAASRFVAGVLAFLSVKYPNQRFIPTPRTMLFLSAVGSFVFMLVAVVIRPTEKPNLMAVPIVLFFFAEGPMWPLIFSLGLRGQGKRTKRASAWLTMGASGPAFWPFVSYAILQKGGSVQTAFIVVVALVTVSLVYPLFLTFVKDARVMVDHVVIVQTQGSSGPGPGGGLARIQSEAPGGENTLDQIIEARKKRRQSKALEDAAEKAKEETQGRGDGRARDGRLSGRFFGWRKVRKDKVSNTGAIGVENSVPSPLVEHYEQQQPQGQEGTASERQQEEEENDDGDQDRIEEQPRSETPPWEKQVLDTRLLDGI